jgi:hypothetical protein
MARLIHDKMADMTSHTAQYDNNNKDIIQSVHEVSRHFHLSELNKIAIADEIPSSQYAI